MFDMKLLLIFQLMCVYRGLAKLFAKTLKSLSKPRKLKLIDLSATKFEKLGGKMGNNYKRMLLFLINSCLPQQ